MRLTFGQHGQPASILDMGETAIDEQIFEEYLEEMREHYTADKVYSLPMNNPDPEIDLAFHSCSITSWVNGRSVKGMPNRRLRYPSCRFQLQHIYERLHRVSDGRVYPFVDNRCVPPPPLS
jgi:hypothetical protein